MNLQGQLSVQDFTTLDRVKAFVRPTIGTTDLDSLIPTLITAVSGDFVRFMGLHAVLAERTETYQIRRFAKSVHLDAKPISTSATFSLKYGSHTSSSYLTTYTASEYVVHNAGGWVKLLFPTPHQPGLVEVTYTGGLGTNTADIVARFPEIALAADQQVAYLLQRRGTLGGNMTIPAGGGATQFEGEYGLLKHVQAKLAMHRRAA